MPQGPCWTVWCGGWPTFIFTSRIFNKADMVTWCSFKNGLFGGIQRDAEFHIWVYKGQKLGRLTPSSGSHLEPLHAGNSQNSSPVSRREAWTQLTPTRHLAAHQRFHPNWTLWGKWWIGLTPCSKPKSGDSEKLSHMPTKDLRPGSCTFYLKSVQSP